MLELVGRGPCPGLGGSGKLALRQGHAAAARTLAQAASSRSSRVKRRDVLFSLVGSSGSHNRTPISKLRSHFARQYPRRLISQAKEIFHSIPSTAVPARGLQLPAAAEIKGLNLKRARSRQKQGDAAARS